MNRAIPLFGLLCLTPNTFLLALDRGLMEQSIKSTKKSIDREMIDVLYHDAVEAYHQNHNDEALELLDKIYSLDPQYEDVSKLRASIRRRQEEKETASTLDTITGLMKKGDAAQKTGQNVAAINIWKEVLTVNPTYVPAQKKIKEVNQALARKEFESGYIHYRHGEFEEAQEAWSNAIALDPSYKQRGLLLLMSKVQRQVERDQTARLSSQGFEQYQQGNLEAAQESYLELSKLEPRNEEARRMTAKIRIQIGQTALKSAHDAMSNKDYPKVLEQTDKAIQNGYERSTASALKAEAEKAIYAAAHPPKPPKKTAAPTPPPTPKEPPKEPEKPRNPEEAMIHYRKGLFAMRTKDYHQALQELDIAAQLDPVSERIYMARQRAQQEWTNATGGGSSRP